MKSINKRWFFLSALTLIMVLGTAGFAISGFGGFGGGPFHGKGFMKERVLSRMDYTMQELKLTGTQTAKYATIRAKMSKGLDEASAHHDEVRDAMRAEMKLDQPDIKKMAETMKKEIRSMPDTATMQIDYLLEVYDILNPEQQKQLTSMIKERMEKRGGKHGFGRRGGPEMRGEQS